jgi:hypothetical protein
MLDQRNGERTFLESLVKTDSDKIDKIHLFPKHGKEMELNKNGSTWTISHNGVGYPADNAVIKDLINSLNPLKTESVVSSNPIRYKDFELEDSTSTRVKLMQGSELIADLLIGKLEMSSNQNMSTFVRLVNDKVVYSVGGYLSWIVNRELDSYRSHVVIEGNKSDWSKLEFIYPADSSFVLEKQGEGKWHIGTVELNIADVDKYMDQLQNLNGTKFSAPLPPSNPIYTLRISGNKLPTQVEIKGYLDSSQNIVVSSSLNNGNLFDGKDLIDKLFPGKGRFTKQ